jgi:uncharacterized protein (DUF2236 family)
MRFEAMARKLERSDILFEFLAIMRSASILPLPLRPLQPLLVRAAIELTPRLRLSAHCGHRTHADECPLSGVKRTSAAANPMSAFDPKRT